MSTWVKIEVEFLPDRHDPNVVMQHLFNYFKDDDGVPTAVVTLTGFGDSDINTTGIIQLADDVWSLWRTRRNSNGTLQSLSTRKISAIKDFRGRSSMSLKESKEAIDDAYTRNPY